MNEKRIVFACVLFFCLLAPLMAQDRSNYQKRDIYTKIFPIVKVWSSKHGYLVQYRNSNLDIRECYIAMKHFTGTSGKAVLVYGRGPEYPYLSVTWAAGEIDHVTIYAVDNMAALSWGVLHNSDAMASRFTDEIDIKF